MTASAHKLSFNVSAKEESLNTANIQARETSIIVALIYPQTPFNIAPG